MRGLVMVVQISLPVTGEVIEETIGEGRQLPL